ncbi:hypothetical protein BY996DRAFT_6430931 [Phakopsora pachyrhizi]|uniref:Protein CPL1-like domain-containing protein n=1 Tax=Phakopsora pachyrhizi TaxID=170000 RepID=A0A0S1MK27_PHAPC|nr:hypothetical protein BY996DRAFT_6430931 [Phakopsora pachyrhizi]CAH7670081.1 hypothetical protein PPACK8108_LOCUS4758 [Phakopsora pachyrhizi]
MVKSFELLLVLLIFQTFSLNFYVSGSYEYQLNGVNNQFAVLDSKISKIQSLAQQQGHSDVKELCLEAKDHLSAAIDGWERISKVYKDKIWLASESKYKDNVQDSLDKCGESIMKILDNDHVKSISGRYGSQVEDCKRYYETCQHSCKNIWDWGPPSPTPSGSYTSYNKRQNVNSLRRRSLEGDESDQIQKCPKGETACPISENSIGFECLDTKLELTNCGGCRTKNEGENCLEIEGSVGVGCMKGKCVVFSVQPGYYLSKRINRPVLKRK